MREEITALQTFKSKHGPALSRLSDSLLKLASGAVIGSVVTAGLYTGAIEPAKFFKTPGVGHGEIIKAATSPVIKTDGDLNYAVEAPLVQPETANTDDLLKSKPSARMKLDIDLDPVEPKRQETFLLDSTTMNLADSVNDRANDELDAINVIRKAIEEGEGFADPMIKGSAKADAIAAALDLALVPKDMNAAQYDNHIFRIASGLPKTLVFNEIVETLNWKRQTVRDAIDVTNQLADAIRVEDPGKVYMFMDKLTEIMDNYEVATKMERAADAVVDKLESQSSSDLSEQEGSLEVPTYRDVKADAMERLRDHFGTTVSKPAASISATSLSL
jgi:predicted DNA-binding protein YlxM (UPF0122 family)